jgi:hypothetical protein
LLQELNLCAGTKPLCQATLLDERLDKSLRAYALQTPLLADLAEDLKVLVKKVN